MGAVIPRISEVLTFRGRELTCLGAAVCPPRYIYYSCPGEAAGEWGAPLLYRGKISLPSAGSSRSAAACSCLWSAAGCPSPAFHPAPHPLLRRIFFSPLAYCLCERSPLISHSSLFLRLWIGSGTMIKIGVAFLHSNSCTVKGKNICT